MATVGRFVGTCPGLSDSLPDAIIEKSFAINGLGIGLNSFNPLVACSSHARPTRFFKGSRVSIEVSYLPWGPSSWLKTWDPIQAVPPITMTNKTYDIGSGRPPSGSFARFAPSA